MTNLHPDPEAPADSCVMLTVKSSEQTVQIAVDADTSVRMALDATLLRVRAACGGLGTCGACLIQTVSGDFNPPTIAKRQKIPPEELAIGVRLACQLRARCAGELYLQYPAPHSEWRSLDAAGLYRASGGNCGVDKHVYGVTVDLGTTHIRLSLWNRRAGRRIASRYTTSIRIDDPAVDTDGHG